ncbi:MAG: carbohydrate porin [Desulfobacterales bacterium]
MLKRVILIGMLLCFFAGIEARPSNGEEPAKPSEATALQPSTQKSKISLAEVAPELYYQLRRYSKFYGDDNTNQGALLERSHLLGSVGGGRDFLVDHGFYLDAAVTQFVQGNVTGGKEDGDARHNGTADYWLTFDSGKAGLWSGGAVFLHAESSWQADDSVNADTGALIPANFDATMPTPGDSEEIALPELYLVQALPANLLLLAGKANWAGLADTNLFANNERTQFMDTGLVNNPILGAFVPYTSLGLGGVWAPSKKHTVALIGVQSEGDATSSGFNKSGDDYTLGGQYQFSPILDGNLQGNYRIIVGYSNKDIPRYDIDPRHLIGEIIGVAPVAKKSDNYAFLVNIDQYLWVKGGGSAAGRRDLPPVGVGLFGRAGWAPKDRNVIDQFYSVGIGGYGMIIPGRDNDQWGIGWAGTHISSDLRDDLELLGIGVDDFEHAFETFYNIQLTPAAHLTVNAQLIDTPFRSLDSAFTLGSRLQVDF